MKTKRLQFWREREREREREFPMDQENAAHLHQGIGLLLSAWTALQMAFENYCGGPDSSLNQSQVDG
ncbi:unnamed protein product [Camellia sinensis]